MFALMLVCSAYPWVVAVNSAGEDLFVCSRLCSVCVLCLLWVVDLDEAHKSAGDDLCLVFRVCLVSSMVCLLK